MSLGKIPQCTQPTQPTNQVPPTPTTPSNEVAFATNLSLINTINAAALANNTFVLLEKISLLVATILNDETPLSILQKTALINLTLTRVQDMSSGDVKNYVIDRLNFTLETLQIHPT